MTKYWKIEGQNGLWTIKCELGEYVLLRAEGADIVLTQRSLVRPASFEEIHGRAKPPKIYGHFGFNTDYQTENPATLIVVKGRWGSRWVVLKGGELLEDFPTHAEAIAYAQKHARQ